jgi:SUN domain-containing protein 1/2
LLFTPVDEIHSPSICVASRLHFSHLVDAFRLACAICSSFASMQPASYPGHCWPIAGPAGNLTVRLARPVAVTAVTIDHLPAAVALRRHGAAGANAAAPRSFRVYGLTPVPVLPAFLHEASGQHSGDGHAAAGAVGGGEFVAGSASRSDASHDAAAELRAYSRTLLGAFSYDAAGPQTQTFVLPAAVGLWPSGHHASDAAAAGHHAGHADAWEAAAAGQGSHSAAGTPAVAAPEVYSHVQLEVLDNHGSADFTCLYRFRVHGAPA